MKSILREVASRYLWIHVAEQTRSESREIFFSAHSYSSYGWDQDASYHHGNGGELNARFTTKGRDGAFSQ
ncbi:hypothetical protein TNCV_4623931 [Trichonephila clavipes]|nr:hypothetical protein TNCV_4623931 [Trichonephila clavipes]